jgi:guanylate kinase
MRRYTLPIDVVIQNTIGAGNYMSVILVGGSTGIGKTTIIDALIEGNNLFTRPISYTTRPRRPNENNNQYIHISFEEFYLLQEQGVFVNIDEVYGNLYSMSYESIADILGTGKRIIKEVHPKNHAKIKKALPGVISVLFLPADSEDFAKRISNGERKLTPDQKIRFEEDVLYYQQLQYNTYPFDVVIHIGTEMPPELVIDLLTEKLDAYQSRYDVDKIQRINQAGYEFIADEFSDDKRITTANFHDLSHSFFVNSLKNHTHTILDIGAGRGFLLPILERNPSKFISVDLSERMLRHIDIQSQRVCASAISLPFSDKSFKVVASS